MKKTLIITLVALGAIALAGSAFAQISGSAHDLSTGSTSGLSACEYCHTPHNSVPAVGTSTRTPLWNRSNPNATTFTGYGATVSGTTAGTTINTNSLTCLSCHDGVTSINSVYNNKLAGTANLQSSTANIGKNLSNDHPVSFTWSPNAAGVVSTVFQYLGAGLGQNTNWVAGTPGFRLYGASGTFECASCHDPHDNSTGNLTVTSGAGRSDYFLRAAWKSICTDCHKNK